MIVDAPAGATAAMIGNGVKSDDVYAPDVTLRSTSNHGITNTIDVTAGSGDATVANNTNGGNATTGNANAFVNIANVSNSSLSLTGWFGLLFINITGDWLGSFQIDTPYGNPPKQTSSGGGTPGPVQFVPEQNRPARVMNASANRIVIDSRNLGSVATASNGSAINVQTETSSETTDGAVEGVADVASEQTEDSNVALFLIAAGTIVVVGASVVGIRRFI
jgi:hypothetical protein